MLGVYSIFGTEGTENGQSILGDFLPRAEVPCSASKINVRTALMDSQEGAHLWQNKSLEQ